MILLNANNNLKGMDDSNNIVLLKKLNYGYLILIFISAIFDFIFLSWVEMFGGLIFFGSIFVLIALYPKGEKVGRIILQVLLVLAIFSAMYVIYANIVGLEEGIRLIYRILISILWGVNIIYYTLAFRIVMKYHQ